MNILFADTSFYVALIMQMDEMHQRAAEMSTAYRGKVVTSYWVLIEDFEAGLTLFRVRADKQWSLVDCISFAIMRSKGIHDAWTADHHFIQAGFNALLV